MHKCDDQNYERSFQADDFNQLCKTPNFFPRNNGHGAITNVEQIIAY